MDEVENNSAVQEIAAPETSPNESESAHHEEVNETETKQDRNWREIRRRNAELERKAKAQEEIIQNFIQQGMAGHQNPAPQPDELDTVSDQDYIPKGDVAKMIRRDRELTKKEALEEFERKMEEKDRANFHNKLRSKFSDFDDVVTPETLELFEQQDPDLAQTIADLKDPYKMGLQTYKFIKSMGLSSKAPSHRRSKEVEKKMEQNAKTVPSPQSYDKRPMAQTFQMTEQLKKELWREMNEYAQQAGGVPSL